MCTIAFALCTRHRCTVYQYWDGSDAQYVLRERESLASGQVRYSNGACIPVQRNPVLLYAYGGAESKVSTANCDNRIPCLACFLHANSTSTTTVLAQYS